MHPNNAFRSGDRALHEMLIEEVGFGMVFAQTPDGPRVAHTPLVSTGDGAVQFHLSNGNALTKHIADCPALLLVNGPEAYVSARWYDDPDQAPTWNYIALEMDGPVRRMAPEGLEALIERLVKRHEGRIRGGGGEWTIANLSEGHRTKLMQGITGFEMEVRGWRDTVKLSQNKPEAERERLIDGLQENGSLAIANLMRTLGN
ncbi:FMN-binding negative transcriptional regulator [Altererythrobacter aurantiacus]|uniref:FMN-binding negative transcriptional regulator n=1 Tax=Parapontixanthobacter aurantiacus TaxID=1463599 RepID=A0A844Z9Y6_9SPHN|nr:FMN-binding negative transcriptional regulator [Parapontixanthobacter aurantiacus]MXO84618.1 FMN-binding negative transcriptional regulator [Parapontixanthobacter aurantiacus]